MSQHPPIEVPSPKIGEKVAADLRRRIARGELEAGERLATEEELIEEYGAARNTLREAFRILESEGLLEVRRGRSGGVFIAHPGIEQLARSFAVRLMLDETTLDDLYEARQHIELVLVAQLARTRSRQGLDALEQAIGSAAEAAEANDPHEFGIAAAHVHETIMVEAGNHTLATVARMMRDLAERAYSGMKPDQAGMHRAVRSYWRLYGYIETRDPESAVDQLRKQMRFTRAGSSVRWDGPVKAL
jgi:GntR family transcriptional repressor for pyruvate dehydrogenase complex